MANKSTKQLRKQVSAASRAKQPEVAYKTPVRDYHSFSGSREHSMVNMVCPTAVVKGDGVNSVNKRRNSCQRIYLNKGAGGTQSLTCHEPFLKGEHMAFPNHSQYANWEYRRPGAPAVTISA